MKAFVFGALLLRTLNAQTTDDVAAIDVAIGLDDSSAPAPLLVPNPNAPSEADVLGSTPGSVAAGAGAEIVPPTLPVGSDDIIVEPVPLPSPLASPDQAFGAGETAGEGVLFNGTDFNWPTSDGAADVDADATIDAGVDADGSLEDLFNDPGFGGTDQDAPEDDLVGPELSFDGSNFTFTNSTAEEQASIPVEDVVIDDETPSDDFVFPDFGGTDSGDAGVNGAAAEDDESFGNAADWVIDDVATEPFQPDPFETSPTLNLTDAGSNDVISPPELTLGLSDDTSDDGFGAQAEVGINAGSPWTGWDVGNYDGQDYGVESEECPAWCLENERETYEADYTEDEDDEFEYPIIKKRLSSGLGRRQDGPPSVGGFAAFQFPNGGNREEECDEDIPAWLYDASGRRPRPCRPRCPPSCYAPPSRPRPTRGATSTRRPWTRPTTSTRTTLVTSTRTLPPRPPPPPPTRTDRPTRPPPPPPTRTDRPTRPPPPPPTRTDRPRPPPPPPTRTDRPRPPPPRPTEDVEWTGDTLANICPATCNPFNPATNRCDITTSCTTTGRGKYYCACRAGYRASEWNAKDFSKQFRFQGQPYVYTAQGVVCDTVCSDQYCTEVLERPRCQ